MKPQPPRKSRPAPGAGRKPNDGPMKSNVYADLPLLLAWLATGHGRFPKPDTHAAHALVGLAELARRTDLDDINLAFPEGIPRNIHLRPRTEIERARQHKRPLCCPCPAHPTNAMTPPPSHVRGLQNRTALVGPKNGRGRSLLQKDKGFGWSGTGRSWDICGEPMESGRC